MFEEEADPPNRNFKVVDDKEDDRTTDELVGRHIKALYENGWFVGEIIYLNTSLKGNSGQIFFFKKLHSSYRALKCQKNPFCFILITFFVQKLLKF